MEERSDDILLPLITHQILKKDPKGLYFFTCNFSFFATFVAKLVKSPEKVEKIRARIGRMEEKGFYVKSCGV